MAGKPASKTKRTPVFQLFLARIRREGRWREWADTLERLMKETGKPYGYVRPRAMRELGYLGADQERNLALLYEQEGYVSPITEVISEEQKIRQAEKRVTDYEEAIATLPDHCPASMVMDWVAAHPAMSRLARNPDKTKVVLISADDILRAPHGKAPSKEAARTLQHWANCPHEFYKQRLSEQKKAKSGEDASSRIEMDEDIGKIEQLLREVEGEL